MNLIDKIKESIDNNTFNELADNTTIETIDSCLGEINEIQEELDESRILLAKLYSKKKELSGANFSSIAESKRYGKNSRSKSSRKTKS
jgi:hypothetical protein